MITTVAGDGYLGYSGDGGPATAAELNDPTGVAVDSSGNLFFADSSDSVIREVAHATGVITTVAGGGNGGSSYGGTATDAGGFHPVAWQWTPPATSLSPTPATT